MFFMHIAKTAGSYVNQMLATSLGDKFLDHCEVGSRMANAKGINVWSGHIYIKQWLNIERKRGISPRRVTLIREPISQLASHILWLDHYSEPEHFESYSALDESSQRVVDQIGSTDLANPEDLNKLLEGLCPRGTQYLDNCQSRYMISGDHNIRRHTPLGLDHRKELDTYIAKFDCIGTSDNMGGFVRHLSSLLDVKLKAPRRRVNEARAKRKIDLNNSDIRAVLSKKCVLDRHFYEMVLESEQVRSLG